MKPLKIPTSELRPDALGVFSDAPMLRPPHVGSIWQHYHNHKNYRVRYVTNTHAMDSAEYPIMIVYEDPEGRIWSRTLERWHSSFTEIGLGPDYTRDPEVDVLLDFIRTAESYTFESEKAEIALGRLVNALRIARGEV